LTSEEIKKELIDLIQKYPELEIVPMVDYKVCCDDIGDWPGAIYKVKLCEMRKYNDRIYTDISDLQELLENECDTEEEIQNIMGKLSVEKQIIIWIST
jgi:hypothetical protein